MVLRIVEFTVLADTTWLVFFFFFFFKQKTAYEIYQCDWSSDVCSSDLLDELTEAACTGAGVISEDEPELADTLNARTFAMEIGRASCRERV